MHRLGGAQNLSSMPRLTPLPAPAATSGSEGQQVWGLSLGTGTAGTRRDRDVKPGCVSEKGGYLRPQGSGSLDQRLPGRHSMVSGSPGILRAPSAQVNVTLDPTGKLLECSSLDGLEWVMAGGGPQSPVAGEHLLR